MAAIADQDCPPAVEADDGGQDCSLLRCFCCWRKYCSPRIPRVHQGREYIRIPAGADDDRPMWSVLVGCTSIKVPRHNLRVHRFHVAASGRVIGRNDDTLEPLLTVSPEDKANAYVSDAKAAPAPDGRRLYAVCTSSPGVDGAISEHGLPPGHGARRLRPPFRTFAMDPGTRGLSPLPPLPFSQGAYDAVSAQGKLWAPSVDDVGATCCTLRLVMHRLDHDPRHHWVEAASVDITHQPLVNAHLSGSHLQGYAVIGDRFILLSLVDSTFFCFDCDTSTLTPVTTVGKFSACAPISGQAFHFGGDDVDDGMIYFVRFAKLYAYRFSPKEGKLYAPPMDVERLWPYYEEGYGRVVHLAGRMLCAVWISMNEPCGCAERHALITTFLVKGAHDDDDGDGRSFVPTGVEVLHSTCRRVGMLRSRAVPRCDSFDYYCFLQNCLDHAAKVDSSVSMSPTASSAISDYNNAQVEEEPSDSDDMPNCCRKFLSRGVPRLKECKFVTAPEIYFICQVNGRSLVYQISTNKGKLTCHEKLLEPHLSMDTITPAIGVDDPSWHFVHLGSRLYVIPFIPVDNHYVVDVSSKLCNLVEQGRPDVRFSVVSRAGLHIVALGDTLEDVFILDEENFRWLPFKTSSGSLDLTRKLNISGFVDLIDDSFVVSDADTPECFLLDLRKKEWFLVKAPPGWWQDAEGVLRGRCVFAQGFIYACTGLGFIAFELLKENTSYSLGYPVIVDFSEIGFPDRKLVSFDSICKEDKPKSLVFCVVHGCLLAAPFSSNHRLTIATVEVKLEETAQGRKVPRSIDHIDISDSTVDQKGWIWTCYAFSL
ncbi:hypothetical protein ACP70R_020953 [Stipagrostis hirtigluma subsp. patula]